MNLLVFIIFVIIAVFAVSGFFSGFLRKLFSIASWVLTLVLVSAALPYVTAFIKDYTPIYSYIETRCGEIVSQYSNGLLGFDSASAREETVQAEMALVRSVTEQSDQENSFVTLTAEQSGNPFRQNDTGLLKRLSDQSFQADEDEQTAIIDDLPLPSVLKEVLEDNNNAEGYLRMAVSGFTDYIVESLSTLILNVVSFVIAVILVQIVLRIAMALLKVMTRLPVVGMANRIAGLFLGLAEALVLLWIFFLVLAFLQTISIGTSLAEMVQANPLLNWLYENNLLWNIITSIL